MGRAVKIAKETTRTKSVVKWFTPKSVPASQSHGNAEAYKVDSINFFNSGREYKTTDFILFIT